VLVRCSAFFSLLHGSPPVFTTTTTTAAAATTTITTPHSRAWTYLTIYVLCAVCLCICACRCNNGTDGCEPGQVCMNTRSQSILCPSLSSSRRLSTCRRLVLVHHVCVLVAQTFRPH
jgi:hypothetical protein